MKNSYDEMIAVLEAKRDGRPVELMIQDKSWSESSVIIPAFNTHKYRVKPEPIVRWMNKYPDGKCYYHINEVLAINARTNGCIKTIKLVEEL